DVFLVVWNPAVLLPLVEEGLDVREVLLFVPTQLKGLQAFETGIFLFKIRKFIFLCLGSIGMKSVEIVVARLLEILPDLVGILSGYMANGFPFALDALHFRGGRIPVLTVLQRNCQFQQGPFSLEVLLLFLFLIFIKGIFV